MMHSKPRSRPDAVCRDRYILLARECRQRGLDSRKVKKSALELCRSTGTTCFLKDAAYRPTAIALGCPLPDKRVTRQLWRLTQLVNKLLIKTCPSSKHPFAFVPPDWYHVTLVNRSHFEFTDITLINDDEKVRIRSVIAELGRAPIVLHFNGLLLTANGRLFVPGFPCDDRLYRLRTLLVQALPQLGVNVPQTAHIKLGHVLVELGKEALKELLGCVTLCGERISARLIFSDAYTPIGRVKL
jgi:hypothetical protein